MDRTEGMAMTCKERRVAIAMQSTRAAIDDDSTQNVI